MYSAVNKNGMVIYTVVNTRSNVTRNALPIDRNIYVDPNRDGERDLQVIYRQTACIGNRNKQEKIKKLLHFRNIIGT